MSNNQAESIVAGAIDLLQDATKRQRIRWEVFFKDADRHHNKRVSPHAIRRGFKSSRVPISTEQVDALIQEYTEYDGLVNYQRLCDEIDLVFTVKGLEKAPTYQVKPVLQDQGNRHYNTFQPGCLDNNEYNRLEHGLNLLRTKIRNEGTVVKFFFTDFDRHNVGFVSENQFRRGLEMMFPGGSADEDLVQLIVRTYADESGDVNYRRFAVDTDIGPAYSALLGPAKSNPDADVNFGSLLTRNDTPYDADAVQAARLREVESKMHFTMFTEGIRLGDFFEDLDKMRKYKVPAGKFKSAIHLALGKQVPMTAVILDGLAAKYASTNDPGMVEYRSFLNAVDVNATMLKDLHLDPLKMVVMSEPKARNNITYTPPEVMPGAINTDLELLLAKIRSVVSNRRPNLQPVFEDFDRMHLYQVTREQFMRVLAQELSQVYLTKIEMEILAEAFCTDSRSNKVDYISFIQTVDDMFGGSNSASTKNKSTAGMAGQNVIMGNNSLLEADGVMMGTSRAQKQQDALNKARRVVKSLRVRLCEFLEDADRLRQRVISMDQYLRGMSRAQLPMTNDEFQLLAEPYLNAQGQVKWRDLLDEIQRVEWETGLHRDPLKSGEPVPLVQPASSFHMTSEEVARTDRILEIVRAEVRKHRIILEPPFIIHDKLNHGKLSMSLFRRALSTLQIQPLAQQSEEILTLLAHRFLEPGQTDMVNYVSFIRAVDYNSDNSSSKLFQMGDVTPMIKRRSTPEWKSNNAEADPSVFADLLTRLQDQCWSRGVRVKDFLCDFDRLRKGRIQTSKFLGALKTAGLLLTPKELGVLRMRFQVDGDADTINYMEFVHLLDGGDERLETDPEKIVNPRVGRTSEQRNVGNVSKEDIMRVLAPMRSELKMRPLDLKEQFKHFDRQNIKAVTVNQLSSVLKTNNLLPQDPGASLEVLHKAYPATHPEKVDFRKFIRDLDSLAEKGM